MPDDKLIEFWTNELIQSSNIDTKFIECINDICEFPEWNRLQNYDNLVYAYRQMKDE